MLHLAIVFGGYSAEHDISILSAQSIAAALDTSKFIPHYIGLSKDNQPYIAEEIKDKTKEEIFDACHRVSFAEFVALLTDTIDVCFPIIHGPGGEDGKLQGFFSTLGVPYVGAGVLASALCMDKWMSKQLLDDAGIPTLPAACVYKRDFIASPEAIVHHIQHSLSFPVFVKPCNMGSSIGITKVTADGDLILALETAFKYDERVLVEQGIEGVDVECAVIGNDAPKAMSVGEIIPNHEFYDFESKYTETAKSELLIPAPLDDVLIKKVQSLSLDAYKALNIMGLARVDFLIEKGSNDVYLNEINTLPGYTKYSMYPSLCADAGLDYTTLITTLIEHALEVHAREQSFFMD